MRRFPLFLSKRADVAMVRIHMILVAALLAVTVTARATEKHPSLENRISRRLSERPNIIFLLTDDQRDNTFGAMGHPIIKTPNLDRLLRQSVRFSNTYIAEPTCSPSRIAFLTGVHERVNGIGFTSSYQLTESQWQQTYPALLRQAGYFTGFVGKFGVEYYTFKEDVAKKFDFWHAHDGWTRFFPKDSKGLSCTPYHEAKADVITSIMGECIEGFFDALPEDKPFCLSVSFNVPHGSQTTSMYPDYPDWRRMTRPANENPKLKGSRFYDTLYRNSNIEIPEATATDPYTYIPKFIMDQDKGRRTQTYPYSYTRPTCLEHHVRYYQTIAGLDHVIGGLLIDLGRRGLAENTIIIYASDHGLLMGEYGMGGKALLYDLAAKIPCFVYDPSARADSRNRCATQLVSSLDITTTILDYAGVKAPEFMVGRSLRPLVEGREVAWRDELFLENLYTGRDTPFQEGVRMGKWKYVRMFDGVVNYDESDVDFSNRKPEFEMLFDLEADPREIKNLIESHSESQLVAKLRTRCAAHSEELNQKRKAYVRTVSTQSR